MVYNDEELNRGKTVPDMHGLECRHDQDNREMSESLIRSRRCKGGILSVMPLRGGELSESCDCIMWEGGQGDDA